LGEEVSRSNEQACYDPTVNNKGLTAIALAGLVLTQPALLYFGRRELDEHIFETLPWQPVRIVQHLAALNSSVNIAGSSNYLSF
jgi:hypothetical protein